MEILRNVRGLPTWDAEELGRVLEAIGGAVPAARFDWDVFAWQEWARVLSGEDEHALIRAPTSVSRSHRFAFVRSASPAALHSILQEHAAEVVELASFDDVCLSARADDLVTFFGPYFPHPDVFDPSRFSAKGLWLVSL